MEHAHCDYLIIGMGCAGSHLVLEMIRTGFASDNSIIIIDDFHADSLDKTWSYWEESEGNWDHLLHHSWEKGDFFSTYCHVNLNLAPYLYKSIQSRDFIAFAKAQSTHHPNIVYINNRVNKTEKNNAYTDKSCIRAKHIFDSRMDKNIEFTTGATGILQHFKGFFIETPEPVFDPERFTMMDYRLKKESTTSFMYVLPTSPTRALVEFTFFSPELEDNKTYVRFIERYLKKYLNIDSYEVIDTEKGIIPMTDYKFENSNTPYLTKIGTAGGWVKPSTGYSFKNCERFAKRTVQNLLQHKTPTNQLFSKKHRFYDSIFIQVLRDHNDAGEWIFSKFYSRNPIQKVFKFLDEKTTLWEEVVLINSLTSMMFITAFYKKLFRK